MAFRGTYDHTLDAKNRLTVPARYRRELADGVVMGRTADQQPCVGIWLSDDYDRYTERALAEMPPISPERIELQRFLFGNSADGDLDAAGRLMLPAFLMEHAGLEREVVVVGVGDHLELWSRERWNEHQPTLLRGVAQITERIGHSA